MKQNVSRLTVNGTGSGLGWASAKCQKSSAWYTRHGEICTRVKRVFGDYRLASGNQNSL